MRPYGFLLPIAIASSYLVPPNLDNSLVKDLPPYLSEQELRNYLEDTFDVVSVHKGKKKLSDYKYQSPREFETVVIGGSFVVYPDAKSGDFDVFFKNKDQEEPEVNAFENEVQAQDEYNRLHNDSRSNLQKQTFNVVNDLDKQPDKDSNKDGKQPK